MPVILILHDSAFKLQRYAIPANQEVVLFNLILSWRLEVLVVEPIFTLVALDHELVHVLSLMGLLTVTVAIEEVLVVVVSLIFVIFFIIIELTSERHPTIATVTSEV